MLLALTRPQWHRLVYDRLRRIRFVTRSLSLASVLIHILQFTMKMKWDAIL